MEAFIYTSHVFLFLLVFLKRETLFLIILISEAFSIFSDSWLSHRVTKIIIPPSLLPTFHKRGKIVFTPPCHKAISPLTFISRPISVLFSIFLNPIMFFCGTTFRTSYFSRALHFYTFPGNLWRRTGKQLGKVLCSVVSLPLFISVDLPRLFS